MQAVKLFKKSNGWQPEVDIKCGRCADKGVVQIDGGPVAKFGWHIFFTMRPCGCNYGQGFVKQFEDGQREYGPRWEKEGFKC